MQYLVDTSQSLPLQLVQRIRLVPIVAHGKNGRLATTADTFEQWIKERGRPMRQNLPLPHIIGLSSQPRVLYQDATAKLLANNEYHIVTIGTDPHKLVFTDLLDVFAAYLYTMKALHDIE